MPKDLPSPEMLRKLLEYDPETGGLTWRHRTPDLFEEGKYSPERMCNIWNSRYSGKPAFTATNSNGYLHGQIFGRKFLAARVIWAIKTGAWPSGQIDHVNGERTDNRLENLREVTNAENCKNQARRKTNTSGAIGVCFHKQTRKWRAQIRANGKYLHLGLFTSKSDAIAARQAAEIEHGFHENHGRK